MTLPGSSGEVSVDVSVSVERSGVAPAGLEEVCFELMVTTTDHSDTPIDACYRHTGAYNPLGDLLHVGALLEDTYEACGSDMGKAYWQTVIGGVTSLDPFFWSCLDPFIDPPQAWCSEFVSYVHRQAGVPYSHGYTDNAWGDDWKITVRWGLRSRGHCVSCDIDPTDETVLVVSIPCPVGRWPHVLLPRRPTRLVD